MRALMDHAADVIAWVQAYEPSDFVVGMCLLGLCVFLVWWGQSENTPSDARIAWREPADPDRGVAFSECRDDAFAGVEDVGTATPEPGLEVKVLMPNVSWGKYRLH